MKPRAFDYCAPETLAEALDLMASYGQDARPLAGGQSLVPMLNFRLSAPAVVIDLNRIGELRNLHEEDGCLRFGAMVRQRTIEFSPLVTAKLPIMVDASRMIGHLPTRTRGTIGGSVAHADPAAEYPLLIVALDAEMTIASRSGVRTIGAEAFFRGPMSTALAPHELLTELKIAIPSANTGWAFEEFSRRHGDFAIAETAALVSRMANGQMAARVAVAGVEGAPLRLREVEEIIESEGLTADAIDAAARRAGELVKPISDLHADATYRRHLTTVLVRRALLGALDRLATTEN
jgi:CO/xanthine dehydrogenase FAD-binding subunit